MTDTLAIRYTEKRIVKALLEMLCDNGATAFAVDYDPKIESAIIPTTMDAIFKLDECMLYCYMWGKRYWIKLVCGNGSYIISDYIYVSPFMTLLEKFCTELDQKLEDGTL